MTIAPMRSSTFWSLSTTKIFVLWDHDQAAPPAARQSCHAFTMLLTVAPDSKMPAAKYIPDIAGGLTITWDTAGSLDGAWACIVGSKGQMNCPELIEHFGGDTAPRLRC